MEKLFKWLEASFHDNHSVILAAIAHYNFVRNHPFDEGNGRRCQAIDESHIHTKTVALTKTVISYLEKQ